MKQKIDCEEKLTDKELALALYASTEEQKQFIQCYNEQYSFKKGTLKFKKIPIKYDSEIGDSRKIDNKKEKEFLSLFRKVIDDKFEYEKFYFLQKKLSQHKHVLARMLESYIYVKLNNMSRAKRILLDITQHDLAFHYFVGETPNFSLENQILLTSEILKELGLYFEGQNEFKNLIYYLYAHTSGRFQRMILDDFEPNLKLSKMRELYGSYSFGKPYPFLWGPIIFERSSMVEYVKALDLAEVKTVPSSNEDLLFYRDLEAIPRHSKQNVLSLFDKTQSSRKYYDRHLTIVLLENESFFKFISANKIKPKKILAALKRDFYKSLLKENRFPSFAIFQLMSLGDWDSKYISQLAIYENDRL